MLEPFVEVLEEEATPSEPPSWDGEDAGEYDPDDPMLALFVLLLALERSA